MRILSFFSVLLYVQAQAQMLAPAGEAVSATEIAPLYQVMDSTICDGFDFPVGDLHPNPKDPNRWQLIETSRTVETWKGKGKMDTEHSQPVYAMAKGKVRYVGTPSASQGTTIQIEHRYVENGQVIRVLSEYSQLGQVYVKKGDHISRRQKIASILDTAGNPARLDFAIYDLELLELPHIDASAFIKAHRKLMVPYKHDKIVLVHKSAFKCYVYEKGKLQNTYEIALAQVPVGRKEKQGDLKVPEGQYQICEKTKGPFSTAGNWSAAYLGTRWLCLNYPNTYDAQWALNEKRITPAQFKQIEKANKAGVRPPQNTSLGGAVGIHGWIEEDWSNDSDRAQTWGCVSFHNSDLNAFYDQVELKTTVIIIP